jgi:hypothetical protein
MPAQTEKGARRNFEIMRLKIRQLNKILKVIFFGAYFSEAISSFFWNVLLAASHKFVPRLDSATQLAGVSRFLGRPNFGFAGTQFAKLLGTIKTAVYRRLQSGVFKK